MYSFSATVTDDYSISVISNTYWNCKADGNFTLSKYDGIGNDVISIDIPKDVSVAEGNVIFSYGDERCIYPVLSVYLNNNCYINTYPNYILCNDEKTVYFYYEEPNETFYLSVYCFDGWEIGNTNVKYITSNNDIMIMSSGKDEELIIIPTHQCNGENVIHVKLVKRPDT